MLLQVQLPRMYPPPRRQCMERYSIFPSISADMYAYMSVHGKVSVLHSSPLPLCLRVCCRIGVWMHARVCVCVAAQAYGCIHLSAAHVDKCMRSPSAYCGCARLRIAGEWMHAFVGSTCLSVLRLHTCERIAIFTCLGVLQTCASVVFCINLFFCFSGTMVWTRQAGTKATCVRARSLCVADARTRTGGGRGQGRGRAGNAGSVGSL